MGIYKDLEGKTLMEVSSGRGGGLDYISRYLNPKKAIGVDISQVQVDYCRKIYQNNKNLFFINVIHNRSCHIFLGRFSKALQGKGTAKRDH